MSEYRFNLECPQCGHRLDDPLWHDRRGLLEHWFQYLTTKRHTVKCPLDGRIISDAEHPGEQAVECAGIFLRQEAKRLYERELRRAKG